MRQTIVEVKGKGVVQVIDWWQELLRRTGMDRKPKRRQETIVQSDLHQSGITPTRVIPRIGRRILDKYEPETRTWKNVYPKPKHQWQRHLHQRMYVAKRFIWPSPKSIDWQKIYDEADREAEMLEELKLIQEELDYDYYTKGR
jgi:hypothetical protein